MSRAAPFSGLPVCAEEQFRLRLLGLVVRILDHERREGRLGPYLGQFGFLRSYAERIETLLGAPGLPDPAVWDACVERWQGDARLPLDRLAVLQPGAPAQSAVLLIAAIEEDPRFSLLIEPEGDIPTLGGMTVFLCDLFPGQSSGAVRAALLRWVELGVLELGSRDAPRIQWTLRVASAVLELASGAPCHRDWFRLEPPAALARAKDWIAPSPASPTPQAIAAVLRSAGPSTLLIRSDRHNGRSTLVRMAAGAATIGVLHLRPEAALDPIIWAEANLVATLARALLMVEFSPGPGERAVLTPAPVPAPQCAIVTSHGASIDDGRPAAALHPVTLPRPDVSARKRHWRRAGWTRAAAQLSDRLLTSGHIHRIAKGAARGTDADSRAAITAALAAIRDPRLETMAHRVALDSGLDDLVLDPAEREEIDLLALRCRMRERLHGTSEAGVKALLSGASGTGKTLAAKHLARTLDRPLYRIDLAATVNKYIGETEKNLEQALAAAEELDVVLLLDEGDALLGKRTEVGSATDRYANMETNFLLQRLEEFRGIIIITTNDGERIDRAFRRRMDAIIPFRLPDQLRRQDILLRQLGEHAVGSALIDEIACRCSFSGGQIHNVVLHARLLALAAGEAIGDAQLVKAVEREYRKTGEHCPLRPALAQAV